MAPFVMNFLLKFASVEHYILIYVFKLSWQQNSVEPSWADSHIKWFERPHISES